MQFLKADTNVEVLVGPAVAVGDGFTPVTTLSLSTADEAELIKHGGATALTVTSIASNTMAAITGADGYYTLDLTTGNLDTEGPLTILINDYSLILPIRLDFMVVNANVYDSLFAAAATDYLQTDAIQISGDSTAADNLELMFDGTGYTDDTAPASRSQVSGIGTGGSGALNYPVAYDNSTTDTIDNAAAVDKGDGTVGIPVTGHAFVAGRQITIAGSTNYNGAYTIVSQTANEVVITETYAAETFAGTETIVSSIEGVVSVGTNTSGTFATTESNPATYNQITHASNAIDRVYAVQCGATKNGITITTNAYLTGSNDEITVQVYDHTGNDWETFRTLTGTNGTTNTEMVFNLFEKHTSPIGTANAGEVYLRFVCSAQSSPVLNVATVVTSAVAATSTMGYEGGSVWVDETSGNSTGTTLGIDGTFSNQSDDFDNGQTIADSLGTQLITIRPGNSVTQTAALQGYTINNVQATFTGSGGTDYIDSTRFNGGFLAGTFTRAGTGVPTFSNCNLNNVTSDRVACLNNCGILGTFTIAEAGVYVFNDAQAAGSTSLATLDFGSLAATASFQRWSGDMTVNNLVSGATLRLHCVSGGDITLNGADATVNITGAVGTVTNNLTGSPTVTNNGITLANVNAEVVDVINTDTYAEPGQGTPAATATLAAKINYLYKAWRNKSTQTATTYSLYADDTTTVDQKATVSDDGTTATKGEVATGP